MMYRKSNALIAQEAIGDLHKMQLQMIDPNLETCLRAAKIKSKNKCSYADAFVAILAIQHSAIVVTGDPEFKSMIKVQGLKVHFIYE